MLPEAIARLDEASKAADQATGASYLGAMTWEERAAALAHLREVLGRLKVIEASLDANVAATAIGYGFHDTPHTRVRVRRMSDRKHWRSTDLAAAVVDAHMEADGTGESPDPWTVRDWIVEAGAFAYWRVGVLKTLGLDPDEFCEKVTGRMVADTEGFAPAGDRPVYPTAQEEDSQPIP